MRISDWVSDVCSSDLSPEELRKIRAELKAADEVPVNSAVQFTPDDLREIKSTIRQAPEVRAFESAAALDAIAKVESGQRPTRTEERRVGEVCGSERRVREVTTISKKYKKRKEN